MWNGTACEKFEVHDFPSGHALQTKQLRARPQGRQGGQWSPLTHLCSYGLNTAPTLMRFLAFAIEPQNALEFGCGLGTTADFVSRFTPGGSRVTCIEPEVMLAEVFGKRRLPWRPTQLAVNMFRAELRDEQACETWLRSTQQFDLVYTFEVAEHIPSSCRPAFVQLLSAVSARLLIFSAARPGQGGVGHLARSMLPKSDWIDLFEEAGLVLLHNTSAYVSTLAYPERAVDISPNVFVMRAHNAEVDENELISRAARVLDRQLWAPSPTVRHPPTWSPHSAGMDPHWRYGVRAVPLGGNLGNT